MCHYRKLKITMITMITLITRITRIRKTSNLAPVLAISNHHVRHYANLCVHHHLDQIQTLKYQIHDSQIPNYHPPLSHQVGTCHDDRDVSKTSSSRSSSSSSMYAVWWNHYNDDDHHSWNLTHFLVQKISIQNLLFVIWVLYIVIIFVLHTLLHLKSNQLGISYIVISIYFWVQRWPSFCWWSKKAWLHKENISWQVCKPIYIWTLCLKSKYLSIYRTNHFNDIEVYIFIF